MSTKIILCVVFYIVLLSSCSSESKVKLPDMAKHYDENSNKQSQSEHLQYFEPINQLAYGMPVRVTLAWEGLIYETTYESIAKDKVGSKIGKIERQVSPIPEKNGDIARNTSEGPSIINSDGKIFEIIGTKRQAEIALELSEEHFVICRFLTILK